MELGVKCWGCGMGLQPEELTRQSTCSKCGRHTHVCSNCCFYDPGHYNDCREPQAERVVDKEKANFCDYFKGRLTGEAVIDKTPDPFAAANALFGKK
ncbi:MAG: hypothetical protein G8345_01270 [Magnetococcales bacterium]|nr:hypothetical protein [Magnetococcales bacterium]NGZ25501.1 hypothetical protein [Magnetococcales bacterium]